MERIGGLFVGYGFKYRTSPDPGVKRRERLRVPGVEGWLSEGGGVGGIVVVPGQTQKKTKQSGGGVGGQSAKINIKGSWPSPALLPGTGQPPSLPPPLEQQNKRIIQTVALKIESQTICMTAM